MGFSLLTEEILVSLVKGSCLPNAPCPGWTSSGLGTKQSGVLLSNTTACITEHIRRAALWLHIDKPSPSACALLPMRRVNDRLGQSER